MLRSDPEGIQALVDSQVRQVDAPVLGIFGREMSPGERERFSWVPGAVAEEWVGNGHFVHVVEPDRFASRLIEFVDHCTPTA